MDEYTDEMTKTLQDLGFKNITHVMWRHEQSEIMMAVPFQSKPSDLADILIKLGEKVRASKIRELL